MAESIDTDQGTLDLIAAVEAVRAEDMAGLAVLIRYGNPTDMVVAAAKLLAVLTDRAGLDRDQLLRLAQHSIEQS